jgi:hypothetical protein
MYNLALDPNETSNLVDYQTFEVRTDITLPGLTTEAIRVEKERLRAQLLERETTLLT